MLRTALLSLTVITSLPQHGRAEITSLTLISQCRKVPNYSASMSEADKVDVLACLQYMAGFTEAYGMRDDPMACIPKNATVVQAAAVYVKFADERPDLWHYPARYTLAAALNGAFPCKR